MNCPHCGSPVEPGAQFCGNCGQPLATAPQSQPAQPIAPAPSAPQPATPAAVVAPTQPVVAAPAIPATPAAPVQSVGVPATAPQPVYGGVPTGGAPASPVMHTHKGETRAIIGLIAAVLSIPGALIPIVGLILSITGIVLGSLSIHLKRIMAILAFVFGGIGLILSILGWVYNVQHHATHKVAISSTTKNYSTACYDITASTSLHVINDSSTCSFTASDKDTVGLSSIFYHVEGEFSAGLTDDNFESDAKKIAPQLAEEASTPTRTYTLDSDTATTFQGEPAHLYNLSANDGAHAKMLLVHHTAPNGSNLFEIDDIAAPGNSLLSMSDIESNLVWK